MYTVNKISTYLGVSSTKQTFVRVVKPYVNSIFFNITIGLRSLLKTVWMLDNTQKGHPKKFQRFGSSNQFVKVTGRTARNCILCEDDLGPNPDRISDVNYQPQDDSNTSPLR